MSPIVCRRPPRPPPAGAGSLEISLPAPAAERGGGRGSSSSVVPMAWDFETDAAFEAKLAWMREFVREEILPLETLELDWRAYWRLIEPLQGAGQGARAVGRPPAAGDGRHGPRPGGAGADARDPRRLRAGAAGVRQPGSGLGQLRAARAGRHRGAEATLDGAAAGRRDAQRLLDDGAGHRLGPAPVHDAGRARRRGVGDRRHQVVRRQRRPGRLPHPHGAHRRLRRCRSLRDDLDDHRPDRHARDRDARPGG